MLMCALGHQFLRLNELGTEVPLSTNKKGLFVVKLADIFAEFERAHSCQTLEVVTNVNTETQQQQQPEANSTAEVAQRPTVSTFKGDSIRTHSVESHGNVQGLPVDARPAVAISRGPLGDLHDGECGRASVSSARDRKSQAMGRDEDARGETQEHEVHGCGDNRLRVCQVDAQASKSSERLGNLLPELCEGMGPESGEHQVSESWSKTQTGCNAEAQSDDDRMERGGRRAHHGHGRPSDACGNVQGHRKVVVQSDEEGGISREREQDGGRCEPRSGLAVAPSDCASTRSTGPDHQEHAAMREWINNSKEGQSECAKIRVSGRMIGSLS